jgi:hypothetical protein
VVVLNTFRIIVLSRVRVVVKSEFILGEFSGVTAVVISAVGRVESVVN